MPLFKFIDRLFDLAAKRLAANFSENLETVQQNRAARLENIPKPLKRAERSVWVGYSPTVFVA